MWKRLFLLVQFVRTYWEGLEVQEGQQVQEVQGSQGFLQSHKLRGLDYHFLPLDQEALEDLVDHDLYMWQGRWLSDIFSRQVNVKPITIILFHIIKSLRLFLKSLNLYMCYLSQNHWFLVDLVVLVVLEILGHQGYQDYHWNLDHLVDLQPIRVEMVNSGISKVPPARRNASTCTLGKLNSPSIIKWRNTDGPHLQDRTQQYTNGPQGLYSQARPTASLELK